ncbi:MAG: hypothetical protein OEZ02_05145 [Anaerolineae bacterium]|nr:hypothetical protein [Anaerolineae bacterium]
MKKMNAMKKALILGILVVGIALGCQTVMGAFEAGDGEPPIIDGTEVEEEQALFSDDFSNLGSGWVRAGDKDVITDYDVDGYRIYVGIPNSDYWARPGKFFQDLRIEVDARKIDGPDKNNYGVICRYENRKNFYAFMISSDGKYGIFKWTDAEGLVTLGASEMQFSEVIQQGFLINHITAACVGDRLSLYVNGKLLIEVRDGDISGGDVGLIAGTWEEGGTDIIFNNFEVFAAE